MYGDIDVMVCDGFTGNIAMKACEGCGKSIASQMKKAFKKNLWTKICALFSKGVIKEIKGSMDYEACGGAMFLGLSKAVVKGHGNSKARGFSICIEQAANAVRGDMVNKIKTMIDNVDLKVAPAGEAEAKAE
jgi:glycerol-3-phosphate acyltransferase PlsX